MNENRVTAIMSLKNFHPDFLRKALACGGLDESLNSVWPDDYDLPWTMAEHGAMFKAISECLY